MAAQILSRDELDRIRKSVLPADHNDLKARRRTELKKLSQDRLQHWPNTLEAARLKKESYIVEKLQKEEEARQEVDKIVRFILLYFGYCIFFLYLIYAHYPFF